MLTDNGSEFSDWAALEIDPDTGGQRTRIFYCHPNSSFEKGEIEQNHRLLRYVLPKRKSSFEGLTQEKVNLTICHVNFDLRVSTSNIAPFDLFEHIFDSDEKVVQALGISKATPRDVFLKPALLKRV